MDKKFHRKIFPKELWTKSFTFWWVVSLATVLLFDILWMSQTTFRPFSYIVFWPILLLNATLLTFPTLFSKNGLVNALVLLVVDVIFIANLMYCRTYFNAIPIHSYGLASNLADFTASVTDSFKWYYLSLPFLIIIAYGVYLIWIDGKSKVQKILPYIATVCGLAFLSWIADAWRGGASSQIDKMRATAYEVTSIAPVYSIPGFLVYDYFKSTEKLSPEEEKEVSDWLAQHQRLTGNSNVDSMTMRKRPENLIIIFCESLESWPIETVVEGKELTPNLNALLKDSTTFYAPHVVSQVGHGRSIDAQLLILSGMLPMLNTVYAYEAVGNKFFTLPKAMKEEGAATFLLTCDKPYVWNQYQVSKAFGIDSLIHAADFVKNETVGGAHRLSDGSFMRQSVEKLKKGEIWKEGEKVFALWVSFSGHYPFKLPEKLKQIKFDGDYPEIVKNYMMTAHYTDSSLITLIDYLKSRSDWEDTMVVITGDHEGLASDRKAAVENPESRKFVDAGQHTPLIILNSPIAGRYEGEMGEIDIYPSLLELMGLDSYSWKGMGQSIFSSGFPGVAIGSEGNIEGPTKEISPQRIDDLKNARKISDLILRFDLLNKEN